MAAHGPAGECESDLDSLHRHLRLKQRMLGGELKYSDVYAGGTGDGPAVFGEEAKLILAAAEPMGPVREVRRRFKGGGLMYPTAGKQSKYRLRGTVCIRIS